MFIILVSSIFLCHVALLLLYTFPYFYNQLQFPHLIPPDSYFFPIFKFQLLCKMVKGRSKTKQRLSLRTSSGSSQKVSKPKPSLRRKLRPRQVVPNVESIEPDSEEASAPQANQAQTGSAEESDSSSSSDTALSSSRRVAQARSTSFSGPQSSATAPVVSSTLSSTITKWMSNKAAAANDVNTRHLFGQLAMAVPLQGSSQLDNIRKRGFYLNLLNFT
jgi:hypothetical protein